MSKSILTVALVVAAIALPFAAPAIGAAIGLSAAVVTAVGSVGLAVASNVLLGPAMPKMPASLADGGRDRLQASLDPTTPRKIVFGNTAMATDVRYQAFTGANQEYLEQIVCVASHEVQSIDEIWLDNEKAWTAAGGAQGRYAGYLTVTPRTVGAGANGIAIDGVWTASCTLTGCAYVHLKAKLTGNSDNVQSPFGSGVTSRMTIRGKGAKVYDPRLDSTVAGGSGTHRAGDQATWAWSDAGGRNPALQELWYELGWKINGKPAVGKGVPPARLDLASYAVAANACDESVALADLTTEPRYRADGVLSEGDDPSAVRESLCAAMNAVLRDAGGKLSLTVLVNDLATPAAGFDENDVQGAIDWRQTPELQAIFNVVRGRRIDPSDNALYQPVDFAEVRLASTDGIDRISSVDYPLVQSNGQAQRLAKQRLQRNQYQGRLQLVGKPSWWQINVGEVFQLSHPTFGWTNKLFRCAGIKISRTGETEIVAIEENAAIYAWDKEEKAAVAPGAPTIYDPTNDPLLNPPWGAVTGASKPEDGATKSRVFRQTTAPVGPTLNDTWVDTSLTPTVTKVWDGLAWQPAANLGARLGENTYGFGGLAAKEAVDLATAEVLNKNLDNISDTAAYVRYQPTERTKLTGVETNATKSRVFRQATAPATPTVNDVWVDTSVTPNIAKVWDGAAWQAAANLIGSADHVPESTGRKWAAETGADVTSGKPLSSLAGRTADQISYTAGGTVDSLKPAEAGAEATTGKSVDILADGTTYARLPVANTTGTGTARRAIVDLAQAHVNKNLANVDSTANNKLGGIEAGATVGSRVGTNTKAADGVTVLGATDLQNDQLTLAYQRTGETERVLLKRGGTTNTELNLGNLYNVGQPNLLFNGSFRLTDSAGKPLGWVLDAGWNWVAGNNEGPFMHAPVGGNIVGASEPVVVAAGQSYSLQGELFAEGVTAGSLNADVQWYSDAAATVLVLDDGEITAVNGASWAKRTKLNYVAPTGAIRARVRFFLAAATNTSAAVRRIKFSGGASESPFSDEKTVDAELLTRAGTGRRLADGRNQTSNRNFGIRSLYNAPTITGSDAGTTATIDITASSFVSDWGTTISYPTGQFTGLAFSTKYYIWRNQPDPATAGDSYGISTALSDALGTGKTYMGYCTTPADGGTSTGGGTAGSVDCVDPDMWVELEDGSFKRARDVVAGDRIVVLDYATLEGTTTEEVEANRLGANERVRLTTEGGAALTLALNTPITLRNGRIDIAANAWRHLLPVKDKSGFRWERCVNVEHIGMGEVSHIHCHGATYAAGEAQGRSILTHNPDIKP